MSKQRVNIPHLLEEPPVIVYPSLAKQFGINGAIILQKLHFLISQAKEVKSKTNQVDGQWWAYNTYKEWHDDHFPWLSERAIQENFLALEKLGIVISRCLSKHKSDRRKWYTINYEVLREQTTQKMCDDDTENVPSTNAQKMYDGYTGTTGNSADSITPPSGDVPSADADKPNGHEPTPKKERPPCKWEPLHDALLVAFGLEKAQMTPKADKIYWTVAHELYVVKMTPDQIPDFHTFMANKAKANDWSDWTVSAMAKYAPDFLRDGAVKSEPEFTRGMSWVD
jgi:hypothetical protein